MDQKKIGMFLKYLRKEKKLTQAQLAEYFNVSDRTISRWETGSNMPDLSILVELADFYNVDIREIIDGERKSEIMNDEEKKTLRIVAEYAENEKAVLLRRLRVFSSIGLFSIIIGLVMLYVNDSNGLPVTDYIMGVCFGLAFGGLLTAVLYSTGMLAEIRKSREKRLQMKIIAIIISIMFMMISFAASIIASL